MLKRCCQIPAGNGPGDIREAFENWIDAGQPEVATIEVDFEAREVAARRLLGMLWHCTGIIAEHPVRAA